MGKITLKEFFESKKLMGIYCDTEKQAEILLSAFNDLGKCWITGLSYLSEGYALDKALYYNNGKYTLDTYMLKDEKTIVYNFEDIIDFKDVIIKGKEQKQETIKKEERTIMEKTIKLRDLTEEGYKKWKKTNCTHCVAKECPFKNVCIGDKSEETCWIHNKDLYSDKFLNQEVKIKKEKPYLTDNEKAILRSLNEKYLYIARDADENLCIYCAKPLKITKTYWNPNGNFHFSFSIFNHLFQFIEWEDNEPYLIKDLLEE